MNDARISEKVRTILEFSIFSSEQNERRPATKRCDVASRFLDDTSAYLTASEGIAGACEKSTGSG